MKKLVPLFEHLTPNEAQLTESRDAQRNLFLAGRMMAAEQKNLNGRNYPKSEIQRAVDLINSRIKEGQFIAGELNHPDNLSIDLKNVSHIITEAWMDGNNAMGKCKILETPSGITVQKLIEGGLKLGVSSRGTGNVNHQGIVEDFSFVTLDIVAQPSGPGCYPDAIREAQGDKKIMTLAEAVVHDPKAQKYLTAEIQKFIRSLTKK
jgi:Kyanoviridae head maturation protease